MPTQAKLPLADGYQLQNYRIGKGPSCGGFSIVHLAHDENDVPLAIKECLPSSFALQQSGIMQTAPELPDEAELRGGRECDNLSVFGLAWEQNPQPDEKAAK